MELTVCIPTAGIGSRLGDLTQNLNKSLLSVDNKPVLSHIIEKYPSTTDFVVPVGFASDLVKQYVRMAHPNTNVIFVDIDRFVGEGSGLGYTLIKCKDFLNKPFIFHSCDTIVTEPIPNIENNWVGLSKSPLTHEFRRVRVEEQVVLEFIDKESKITAEQFTYIGLAGIYDYQDFWESMELGGATAVNLGEVHGLNSLLKKYISTHIFTWFDTGSPRGLESAKIKLQSTFRPNILEKENEAIWFVGQRVIKFSTDTSFIRNRVQRAIEIAGFVPAITLESENMYCYAKAEGRVLSSVIGPPVFHKFLNDLDIFFGQPIKSPISVDEFNKKCYEFYHDKTMERTAQYLARFNFNDGISYINGSKIQPISGQLKDINWELLCEGIPSRFHGDLHFENILIQPDERFVFLDWRQDFAGYLEFGDRYYDLAKLLHGMIVPHKSVHEEQYSISFDNETITIAIAAPKEYDLIRRSYWDWLTINNYSVTKVYSLTALVFLNIAALHHEPYCHFLYNLGRYMLNKGIDEHFDGTLPNTYLDVSRKIDIQNR
jgi:hypothetical protein